MAAAAPAVPAAINFVQGIAWARSDLLAPGDDAEAHFTRALAVARASSAYQYPAGHARAGQLNEEPDGSLKQWLMTTVEQDLMQDTVMLQGPADYAEHKLVGHPFAVPDRAPGPADFVSFDDATAAQVRNHLIRKCSEAVTVSSMVAQMRGDEFYPESEELGVWFDNLCRKRKRVKASVSLREFFEIVEKLLPGED